MISEFISRFKDIEFVYISILIVLSIGLIISSFEDLYSCSVYKKTGLLSWKISKYKTAFFANNHISKAIDFVLNDQCFIVILYLKAIFSICLFASAVCGLILPFLTFAIFIFMLLISMRSQFGLDGAFQMNLVVLFAVTIAIYSGVHSKIASICLWFIAGELILSYFIAGINKIISPIWRKTHALNAIFSTRTYGHDAIYKIIKKYKYAAFALCWPVFIFETSFAASFFSEPIFIIFCLIGISFHLFNAMFMGLNTFLFSFLSTYPALAYCFFIIKSLHEN